MSGNTVVFFITVTWFIPCNPTTVEKCFSASHCGFHHEPCSNSTRGSRKVLPIITTDLCYKYNNIYQGGLLHWKRRDGQVVGSSDFGSTVLSSILGPDDDGMSFLGQDTLLLQCLSAHSLRQKCLKQFSNNIFCVPWGESDLFFRSFGEEDEQLSSLSKI